MVAITATNYATPPTQAWQGRARVEQARREAERAEANARQLRGQAEQAEQDADKGQARVSSLRAQVAQTDNTYSAQLQREMAGKSARQTQAAMAPVATVAGNRFDFPANPLQSRNQAWAANTQGQSSGRLLDLSV